MTAIQGLARLGANPELKYVGSGDDKQPVCEMRLRYLNSKQDRATGEWKDQGFWAQVNIWGRSAEPAAKMFSTGDRVYIDGNMVVTSWPDKENEGQEASGIRIDANFIAPYLPDLDALSYKARSSTRNQGTPGGSQGGDADSGPGAGAEDDAA